MSKIRSKSVGDPSGIKTTFGIYQDGVLQNESESLTSVNHYMHSGRNVPGFHSKKRRGELLPFTPWLQFDLTGSTAGFTKVRNTYSDTIWTSDARDLSSEAWLIELGEIQALAKELDLYGRSVSQVGAAASKAYSSGWDALTFIAEFHKVIRMFRDFLKNLGKLAESGEIWNSYLEGRYGWRILIFDLIEINDLLANLDEERKRVTERVGYSGSYTNVWSATRAGGYGLFETTFQDKVSWSVRGALAADFSPPKIRINPIATAWELIPFSFVIDWVINVGQLINSASFVALASKYESAAGYYLEIEREVIDQTLEAQGNWELISISQTGTCTAKLTSRTPVRVPKLPSLQLNLDSFKIMDLVSLVLQRIT